MSLPSYGSRTCKSGFHRKLSPASASVIKGGPKYSKDMLLTMTMTAVAPESGGIVVRWHSLLLEVVHPRVEQTTLNKH